MRSSRPIPPGLGSSVRGHIPLGPQDSPKGAFMRQLFRIRTVGLAVAGLSIVGLAAAPAAAAGTPTFHLKETVLAQTTLATLGQTVDFPAGSFTGGINMMNGKLTGKLSLPDATTTVDI